MGQFQRLTGGIPKSAAESESGGSNNGTAASFSGIPAGASGTVTITADKVGSAGDAISITGIADGSPASTVTDYNSTGPVSTHNASSLAAPRYISFLAKSSYDLTKATTRAANFVNGVTGHNIWMTLRNSEQSGDHRPSGAPLATSDNVHSSTVGGSGSDVQFSFPTPSAITSGTWYSVVFHREDNGEADEFFPANSFNGNTADLDNDFGNCNNGTGNDLDLPASYSNNASGNGFLETFSGGLGGNKTIDTLIGDWNTSNSVNTATVSAGGGEKPDVGEVVTLSGGVARPTSASLDIFHQENFETTVAANATKGLNSTYLTAGTFGGVLSDETTSPIETDRSIKYTAGATSTNDWFDFGSITLDTKQKGQTVGIVLWPDFTNFSVDAEFVMWDVTNSKKLTSSLDVVTGGSSRARFTTSVFIPSDCNAISYGFHMVNAPVNTESFIFDSVEFSTNPFVYKNLMEENITVKKLSSDITSTTATISDLTYSDLTIGNIYNIGGYYQLSDIASDATIGVELKATNGSQIFRLAKNLSTVTDLNDTIGGGINTSFVATSTSLTFTFTRGGSSGTLMGDNSTEETHIILSELIKTENIITPAKAQPNFYALSFNSSGVVSGDFHNITDGNATFSGGSWHVPIKSGIFSVAPFGFPTFLSPSVAVGDIYMQDDSTAIDIHIAPRDEPGSSGIQQAFQLLLVKKDADYVENFGLTAIPVQRVAYVEVHATNYVDYIGGTTSFKTRTLTGTSGPDASIISVDSNQITLPKGRWDLSVPIASYAGATNVNALIYNITKGENLKDFGIVAYSATTSDAFTQVNETFDITETTVIEIRTKAGAASGSEGIGRIKLVKLI